jgi:NADH-quinone oxidoreductase subunit M
MIFESMPLSLILIIPVIGAIVCLGPWFTKERDVSGRLCKGWAVFVACLVTALLGAIVSSSATGTEDSFLYLEEYHPWMPSLGASFHFTLDGLSVGFCAMTCLISLAVICWSSAPTENKAVWYAMLLFATSAVLGSFLATDLVAFYVFYELMLLPVLAGIAIWGGDDRKRAVFKFLMYTLSGSVLMLVAIVYLGWQSSQILQPHSGVTDFAFTISTLTSLPTLTTNVQVVLCAAFLVALGLKIPIVPLHGWLVDTYRQAPVGLVAFIAALLGKVGVYGIIRFVLPLFPDAMSIFGPFIVALGAVGVAGGALMAWVQRDVRSMLAYSSLSHLGFCVIGIGVATTVSISGAVFQAISHGFVTGGLFLAFGRLAQAIDSDNLDDFGGLADRFPVMAFFTMILTVAAVALPLTSGFVGEFLVLMSAWQRYPGWAVLSGVGIVIGAVYMLRAYRSILFGEGPRLMLRSNSADVRGLDLTVLASFAVMVFAMGIAPSRLLSAIESSVVVGQGGVLKADRARLGSLDPVVATGIDLRSGFPGAVKLKFAPLGSAQSGVVTAKIDKKG